MKAGDERLEENTVSLDGQTQALQFVNGTVLSRRID